MLELLSGPPIAVTFQSFTDVDFWTSVGIIAGTYTIFALGLQLNVGFTGIYNFGQAAFMAIGAYSMAILTTETGISFWLSLPIAVLIAIAFALLVGLPSLRLRSDYFAIATIAAAEAIRLFALNARGLTGGAQGKFGFSDSWDSLSDTIQGWISDLGWTNVPRLFPLFLVVWVVAILLTLRSAASSRRPGAACCARSARTRTPRARWARTPSPTSSSHWRSPPRWEPSRASSSRST